MKVPDGARTAADRVGFTVGMSALGAVGGHVGVLATDAATGAALGAAVAVGELLVFHVLPEVKAKRSRRTSRPQHGR